MPDSSVLPVRSDESRSPKAKAKADGTIPTVASVSPSGPRKLIRPRLPAGTPPTRYAGRVSAISPVPAIHKRWNSAPQGESSHAEAFYFQKQIHSQTQMVFVLEDAQQIEGHIEWYDRNSIKVRHGSARTLIYKSSIKYLYKAADQTPV